MRENYSDCAVTSELWVSVGKCLYVSLIVDLSGSYFSILLWEPPEGLSVSQALDNFLQKRVEILGGRGQGAWSVDCEALQSVPNLASKQSAGHCTQLFSFATHEQTHTHTQACLGLRRWCS